MTKSGFSVDPVWIVMPEVGQQGALMETSESSQQRVSARPNHHGALDLPQQNAMHDSQTQQIIHILMVLHVRRPAGPINMQHSGMVGAWAHYWFLLETVTGSNGFM